VTTSFRHSRCLVYVKLSLGYAPPFLAHHQLRYQRREAKSPYIPRPLADEPPRARDRANINGRPRRQMSTRDSGVAHLVPEEVPLVSVPRLGREALVLRPHALRGLPCCHIPVSEAALVCTTKSFGSRLVQIWYHVMDAGRELPFPPDCLLHAGMGSRIPVTAVTVDSRSRCPSHDSVLHTKTKLQ
jgi:hypothetical protein